MSVTYPDDERPDNSRSVLANMVGNTVQDLGPSMRLHRQLASLSELRLSVKERDRSMCRYCGCEVDWSDRRGGMGGTYHLSAAAAEFANWLREFEEDTTVRWLAGGRQGSASRLLDVARLLERLDAELVAERALSDQLCAALGPVARGGAWTSAEFEAIDSALEAHEAARGA